MGMEMDGFDMGIHAGSVRHVLPQGTEALQICRMDPNLKPLAIGWLVEVRAGIEPAYRGFADPGLTTWLPHQLSPLCSGS